MSHTLYPMRQPRLQRSELAVPGSNTSFIDKAAESAADFVFLDLEDAVAPPDKEQARRNVIEALRDIDWAAKGKTVSVRDDINPYEFLRASIDPNIDLVSSKEVRGSISPSRFRQLNVEAMARATQRTASPSRGPTRCHQVARRPGAASGAAATADMPVIARPWPGAGPPPAWPARAPARPRCVPRA